MEWQPTFDDLERELIHTTFVVVDLETTGGSPASAEITEIGAVKIRGGEVIGEFQTLVNPGSPIPPYITVLTGITDAMVVEAPRVGEAFLSFLEFAGSADETVLVAHNAAFDIGFLRSASTKLSVPWPKYEVLDTVRLARHLLGRDEVANFKLSTLAARFSTNVEPNHRALSDARATVDVLHALIERAGTFSLHTLEALRSFTNRLTDAQKKKRGLADGLPSTPGVYIFRAADNEPLYIGTTKNLRSRVKSYFTASETRKRVHDMLALAERIDVIETPTVVEAEIREIRLISERKPRFNRRSKFQEKAIWITLSNEIFPRIKAVRGDKSINPASAWAGPFNGREEAERAIEAIHDHLPLRQCTPRITVRSMKSATPCALFGMGKCGAPCIGAESIDTYATHISTVEEILFNDSREIAQSLLERMERLALAERFEEAAAIRNRLGALIGGVSRSTRIRSLVAVKEMICAVPRDDAYEVFLIRYGRLCGSLRSADLDDSIVTTLQATGEVLLPSEGILPYSSHEEVERILRALEDTQMTILHIDGEWTFPTFSGASMRERFVELRERREEIGYSDALASSRERFTQRSRS